MKITKIFKVTLDEPTPHWMCADNLTVAVNDYIKESGVEVQVEEVTDSNQYYDLYTMLYCASEKKPKDAIDGNAE